MQKYPVISKSGEEYLVDIYEDKCDFWLGLPYIGARLYKVESYQTGRLKKKTKQWHSHLYSYGFSIEDREYGKALNDYVYLAKAAVEAYEKSIEDKKAEEAQTKARLADQEELFDRWDGRC